jgi:hypothetical protein
MPSLEGTRAAYVRALSCFDTITITHGTTTATARGRIADEASAGLSDSIEQSRLKAIILADDLAFVPARGDVLQVGGSTYVVTAVDDATRRLFGVTIAYEVTL